MGCDLSFLHLFASVSGSPLVTGFHLMKFWVGMISHNGFNIPFLQATFHGRTTKVHVRYNSHCTRGILAVAHHGDISRHGCRGSIIVSYGCRNIILVVRAASLPRLIMATYRDMDVAANLRPRLRQKCSRLRVILTLLQSMGESSGLYCCTYRK